MIDEISDKISIYLKSKFPEEMPSQAIIKYSIKFIISNIIPIILILSISLVMGKFSEVATALVGFSLLRVVSGGYHLKSALQCILISTILIFSISELGAFVGRFSHVILIVCLVLILIYAPSNITKMTRVKKENFMIFKAVSFLIVFSNLLIIRNDILTVSFLFQSLLLINLKGGVENAKNNHE